MKISSRNKLVLFLTIVCIGHTTLAKEDEDVVTENRRLKSTLLSHHIHLYQLKGEFIMLEYSIKEAIIVRKTDDEEINKLLGKFFQLLENFQHKLENVYQENNATIESLLKNIRATHAAERKNEGDFVSAVTKAEGFVRDISEKGLALSKEALKRANTFGKQNIALSEKMNSLLLSAFDRVVAKHGEYMGQKSKEKANEEKEGNDQVHEF